MLDVFINVIMPVFLVAVVAGAFQRWKNVSAAPISQITLYILAPCLIFKSLVEQEIPSSVSIGIVLTVLCGTTVLVISGYLVSKIMRHDGTMRGAFILSTAFPNVGNLALPVLMLAFGEEGLAIGVIIFVTQATIGFSFGVFVVANSNMNVLQAIKQIFKIPAIYATTLAFIVRALGIELPVLVAQPITMLGQSAIPMMLVVLGLQFGNQFKLDNLINLSIAVILRLFLSAPLIYVTSLMFNLTPLAQGVVIIAYAMPVAVFTIILATEFKTNPKFVTNAVVTSTVASTITLAILIPFVKTFLAL